VTLQTLVGDQPTTEESVIADGASHPVRDGECLGSEQAEWSRDGQRLFRRADVTCGKSAPRRVSGLAFLTRTDNAPLLGLALTVATLTAGRRVRGPWLRALAFLATAGAVTALVALPWFVWNLVTFGTPWQVSVHEPWKRPWSR
jgi:hypothetical protein